MFFAFTTLAEWRPMPIDSGGPPARLARVRLHHRVPDAVRLGVVGAHRRRRDRPGDGVGAGRAAEGRLQQRRLRARGRARGAARCSSSGTSAATATATLAIAVVCSGALFVLANVMLVCIAIGLSTGSSPLVAFRDHLRLSGPIFAIMIFVAMQAVIFWRLSAPLVMLLSAPLFALTLYQRSSVRHRVAEEEAATDSLTGLKNRREFERESLEALVTAQRGGSRVRALPDRHRPLQAGQRPPRPSRRRRGAELARHGDRARPRPGAATGSAATSSRCCSRSRPATSPRPRTSSSGSSPRRSRAWSPSRSRSAPASPCSPSTPTICTR